MPIILNVNESLRIFTPLIPQISISWKWNAACNAEHENQIKMFPPLPACPPAPQVMTVRQVVPLGWRKRSKSCGRMSSRSIALTISLIKYPCCLVSSLMRCRTNALKSASSNNNWKLSAHVGTSRSKYDNYFSFLIIISMYFAL
jgi:hypothetical protein